MRKLFFVLFNLLTVTVMAQTKGRFEAYDLGSCKLHVYYTNDALVTMEQPLFKDNIAEYNTYLESLNQPVSQRIADTT